MGRMDIAWMRVKRGSKETGREGTPPHSSAKVEGGTEAPEDTEKALE